MYSAVTSPGGLTLLRVERGRTAVKTRTWDAKSQTWTVTNFDAGMYFTPTEVGGQSIDDLFAVIQKASEDPRTLAIRGELTPEARRALQQHPSHTLRRLKNRAEDKRRPGDGLPQIIAVPRCWVMLDIDGFRMRPSDDLAHDPEAAVQHAIESLLPAEFQNVRAFFQLSASAGFVPGILKAHLFFWLSEPIADAALKALLKQRAPQIDLAVIDAVQPHFIAAPVINGAADPIPRRIGWIKGTGEAVTLPALAPRPARTYEPGAYTQPAGDFAACLARMGDGPGLDGFHATLRAATFRYASDCLTAGTRDDDGVIETLRAAIEVAPRGPQRDSVEGYRDPVALQRLIDGGFARLTADVQRLADESLPLDGTPGEYVAKQAWGVPRPAAGWPGAVRWHEGEHALVAVATRDDGGVIAVHVLPVDRDGDQIGDADTRRSVGVYGGAIVRLGEPGADGAPLLLAGTIEAALAARSASGFDTWFVLGAVDAVKPAPGRQVLIIHPDIADLILADGAPAVLRRITADLAATQTAAQQLESLPDGPHYPRGTQHAGKAAGRRLQRVMRAYCDRLERHLAARDWIIEEAARLHPAILLQAEHRIHAKLRQRLGEQLGLDFEIGFDDPDLADQAAKRARRVAPKLARNAARRAAVPLFGRPAAYGEKLRLQIRGAAGLGKTRAFIAEYLRRPTLWGRNIEVYVGTHVLADEFADAVKEASLTAEACRTGAAPRVLVIKGREADGMCHPDRLGVVKAAITARVDSVFRACCFTPASEFNPASTCPHFGGCLHVKQFDLAPGLRIMPHDRLLLRQPAELPLPAPDLVLVDETAIGKLVGSTLIDTALLTDRVTYAAAFGEADRIERAMITGHAVVAALSGGGEAVAAMAEAGVTSESLREAASAASLAARKAQPSVQPSMDSEQAKVRLGESAPHYGRDVAALLNRLARDLEAGRRISVGAEWDAKHTVKLKDGSRAPHPVVRHHGIAPTPRITAATPLLLLDADANLEINRCMFGKALRQITIAAERRAHVTQIRDAALPKITLAPGPGLPNNVDKAERLRQRIADFASRKVTQGEHVLVVTPLQVRRALTGETEPRVPATTRWQGADLTHFGRHLGIDDYRNHSTVIILGREQLPPLDAERIARGLYADDPSVTLDLPGSYTVEWRRHDLREGHSPAVRVQVHSDARVQAIVGLGRENAIAQGIDRLRLIHRADDNPAEVFVLSNLPIPGLVVDALVTLNDVLDGDGATIWDRALEKCDEVLPLSPRWLSTHYRNLFGPLRSAERAVADLNPPLGNSYLYCRLAVYRLQRQKRPSRVLVRRDVADPKAVLSRLFGGQKLADFRWICDQTPEPGQASGKASEASDRSAENMPQVNEIATNPIETHPHGMFSPRHKPDIVAKHGTSGMFSATPSRAPVEPLTVGQICVLAEAMAVLPLAAGWVAAAFGVSARTALRATSGIQANPPPYCSMAVYRLAHQRGRPSHALIRRDVVDPRAALERVLGTPVKEFRMVDTADKAYTPPARPHEAAAPVGVLRTVAGGYGALLDPAAMFSGIATQAPADDLHPHFTVRHRRVTEWSSALARAPPC